MQEEAFLRRGPGKRSSDSSLGKRERPKEKDNANKKPKKDKSWKMKKEKGNSGTKGLMGSKSKKKGSGAHKLHTDWEQAHDGIPQEVVDKRRADKGCTRCGLNNHKWKDCRKSIAIATVTMK